MKIETYYQRNKEAIKAKSRNYYRENRDSAISQKRFQYQQTKEKRWERNIFSKYGLSVEEYNQKLAQQNSKCAICNKTELDLSNSKSTRRLSVDHCHQTGKVRGLLCSKCNTAIGLLRDSPDTLKQAVEYVQSAITTNISNYLILKLKGV